jgi:hypothetical protein
MTIKEKLKEIANSKISTDRWVCVHNAMGYEQGMFLDEIKYGMILWEDMALESELINCSFGVSNGENCIFLEF